MIIHTRKTYHISSAAKFTSGIPDKKDLTLMLFKQQHINPSDQIWMNENEVELTNCTALQLHNFMLSAEKRGINLEIEKQTIIRLL